MYYQELEALTDPMKKEVTVVRKKIDSVNKELKPLGQTCQKKVKTPFLVAIFPDLVPKMFIDSFSFLRRESTRKP